MNSNIMAINHIIQCLYGMTKNNIVLSGQWHLPMNIIAFGGKISINI